jgi:hypothetical protein
MFCIMSRDSNAMRTTSVFQEVLGLLYTLCCIVIVNSNAHLLTQSVYLSVLTHLATQVTQVSPVNLHVTLSHEMFSAKINHCGEQY